ncbi:MAG TPA: hypothetical protein PKU97_02695 [Kofleriaceae bacterium]|nr:hypothetical protein [Kofleriaceae bacterium]
MHPSLLHRATQRARRAVTEAAAALDRNVIRLTERRMAQGRAASSSAPLRAAPGATDADGLAQPAGERPQQHAAGSWHTRERLAELGHVYSHGTLCLPSPFYPAPEDSPLVASRGGRGPCGSQIWELTQASTYQPYWSGARDSYLRFRENLTSHARWWRLPRRAEGASPRPVLVLVHGWRAGAHWLSERVFEVSYWLHHGFDVVAFQLPFHGQRAPDAVAGGARGALFPSGNLARTNEAFGHAIHDLRMLAAGLRRELGPVNLGALGMSLGGYTAALWAAVTDDLAFAMTITPASSIAKLMLARGQSSALTRRAREAGVDEAALDAAFAVHSPLSWAPRLPAERLFVIAGHGDRITPAEHAQALIDHWRCSSHWFVGGHLAQVGRHGALRAARLHLRASGISGE